MTSNDQTKISVIQVIATGLMMVLIMGIIIAFLSLVSGSLQSV